MAGYWVAALKSSDSLERRLAAHALAEIGHAAREAVPALIEGPAGPREFRPRMGGLPSWRESNRRTSTPSPPLVAGTHDGDLLRSQSGSVAPGAPLGRDTLELSPRYSGSCSELLNDNDPSVRAEAPGGAGEPGAARAHRRPSWSLLAPTADSAVSPRVA